jgi:hypothetical protein
MWKFIITFHLRENINNQQCISFSPFSVCVFSFIWDFTIQIALMFSFNIILRKLILYSSCKKHHALFVQIHQLSSFCCIYFVCVYAHIGIDPYMFFLRNNSLT